MNIFSGNTLKGKNHNSIKDTSTNIFVVFENSEQASIFHEYKQHPNIKFTKEENKNGKLSFLDMEVENSGKLIITIYQKPTFTGFFDKALFL